MLGSSCHTYIAEGLVAHNTCEKMAKKRAHVDAILTATAASDIFTQDVEDMTEVITPKEETTVEAKAPFQEPRKKPPKKEVSPADDTLSTIARVIAVSHKDGETGGKPWRLYGIKDENGVIYKTLSESLVDIATTAQSTGLPVKISYRPDKYGNAALAIETMEAA